MIARKLNRASFFIAHHTIGVVVYLLGLAKSQKPVPASVLHISQNVHICYETVQLLKTSGMIVEYLAITDTASPTPDRCFIPSKFGMFRAWQEWKTVLGYVLKFEIIHTHFGLGVSADGWEFKFYKALGRKIVWHHRGCSSRQQVKNTELHPNPIYNICFNCDYNATACSNRYIEVRRSVLDTMADAHIVTTQDLWDFYPQAKHITFFGPTDFRSTTRVKTGFTYQKGDKLRIVQITNHPGIEGAPEIKKIIEDLVAQGYPLDYQLYSALSHTQAMEIMTKADVTIGKMKMGTYANNQIESLSLRVPCITYVREEWRTPELLDSGFIITDLSGLAETLKELVNDPSVLAEKTAKCTASVFKLHDNKKILTEYASLYAQLVKG